MALGIRIGMAQMIGLSTPQIIAPGAPITNIRISANGNQRVAADGNVRVIAGV